MQSQLFSRYSFDECTSEELLFEKLDSLAQDEKIEYSTEDRYTFKIKDIELRDEEIEELLDLFENLDVYPYMNEDADELEFDDYDTYDDDDDYTNSRYKSKGDDYDDY
jgi:hypothetical protein